MKGNFVTPVEKSAKRFVLGPPWLYVQLASIEYQSGSIQGLVQVVVWKVSLQLSVKFLP